MDAQFMVALVCSLLCVGQLGNFQVKDVRVSSQSKILLRRNFRNALLRRAAQNDEHCGISNMASSRVVFGKDASLGEWPWQIAMYLSQASNENGPKFICGGSLIHLQWVVTAAHCILDDDNSKYKIVIGGIDRKKIEKSEQVFGVKRIIKHPWYQKAGSIFNNDIALLQLSRKARVTPFVNTICLPRSGEKVTVGSKCYISGWGQMFHPGDSAEFLQQAAMPVVSNQACEAKLETSPNMQKFENASLVQVTNKMVCAGDAGKTEKSGCYGDSGGPFVCMSHRTSRWVLQGVVSWGDPDCSSSSHYSVFTRVSQFTDWIYKEIEKFSYRIE